MTPLMTHGNVEKWVGVGPAQKEDEVLEYVFQGPSMAEKLSIWN